MADISQLKERVVASMADADNTLKHLRDHIMSAGFRTIDSSAKEGLLEKAEEAMSLLKPGLDKLKEMVGEIES